MWLESYYAYNPASFNEAYLIIVCEITASTELRPADVGFGNLLAGKIRDAGLEETERNQARRAVLRDHWTKDCVQP